MNTHDQVLRDGACCALELAARRGPDALEKVWSRFTMHRRALLPPEFIYHTGRRHRALQAHRIGKRTALRLLRDYATGPRQQQFGAWLEVSDHAEVTKMNTDAQSDSRITR